MDWWRRLIESWTEPDYGDYAERTVGKVRRTVRAVHENPKVAIPLEVERLKDAIHSRACQGGKVHYKEALAIWQLSTVMYEGQITDTDKPKLIPYFMERVSV